MKNTKLLRSVLHRPSTDFLIVPSKNYHPSEELAKELQEHVKKVTAPYKYPRVVEFVTELPKTISGKIRRVQIREEDNEE